MGLIYVVQRAGAHLRYDSTAAGGGVAITLVAWIWLEFVVRDILIVSGQRFCRPFGWDQRCGMVGFSNRCLTRSTFHNDGCCRRVHRKLSKSVAQDLSSSRSSLSPEC